MGDSGRGSERYIEIHYLIFETVELLPCLMKNVMKCIKKPLPLPVSSRPVEESEGVLPSCKHSETITRAGGVVPHRHHQIMEQWDGSEGMGLAVWEEGSTEPGIL